MYSINQILDHTKEGMYLEVVIKKWHTRCKTIILENIQLFVGSGIKDMIHNEIWIFTLFQSLFYPTDCSPTA